MYLPKLKDFFLAHGVATLSKRCILPFHEQIFEALTSWILGRLGGVKRNLAVCMPPRHGKTFIARDLVAWSLGCFPDAEFIYTSCSATLAVNQTMAIKNCVSSDWYNKIFPYVGVKPGRGRQDYFVTERGGAVYGVGMGGTITGFGAGKKRAGFGGGIIIDDPIQAKDAYSTAIREKCNQWYTQVLYSRRNSDSTPLMLIMQRLHEYDLVGYIKKNEYDLWEILEIPVFGSAGKVIWPETFSEDSAKRIADIDPYAFSAQYLQKPTPQGGAMIKADWLNFFDEVPSGLKYIAFFADTAQKTKQSNDFSVFLLAGTDGRNVYILDILRKKLEAPDLIIEAKAFWQKHREYTAFGVKCKGFFVEDKVSGTGLIQFLQRESEIPVIGLQRNKDKVERLNNVLPYIRGGRLLVRAAESWTNAYVGELLAFSPSLTHRYDDQVDVTVDALAELLLWGNLGVLRGADWG